MPYLMKFTEVFSLQEWCLRIRRYCFTWQIYNLT